jgi:hypothetical protein
LKSQVATPLLACHTTTEHQLKLLLDEADRCVFFLLVPCFFLQIFASVSLVM